MTLKNKYTSASTPDAEYHKGIKLINAAVIVASLGYFVDIYDLLLFSIIRVDSLKALGLEGAALTSSGIFLLNVQMVGMLLGGVFWGVMGDKKGRLSVLFGSIFLYSVANIANGFAHSINYYAICRFIAGIGLAGELGAGITLVAELMPKEQRGKATTIVASVGVSGAVAAYFIAQHFRWQTTYFIGGALGLSLLLLRLGVKDSGMFAQASHSQVSKGDFFSLFTNKERFFKYLRCIVIGIPLWFVVGILVTLSPEFGKSMNVQGKVNAGIAVACCYAGLVLGDIISGLLSQFLKSRIKVIYAFLCLAILFISCYFFIDRMQLTTFYIICGCLGISVGYWVIFMTIAAEQFGTNIRATVTTTAPNLVRGALVPLSLAFQWLYTLFNNSLVNAGIIVGIVVIGSAFLCLGKMEETFSKELDFLEESD